MRRALLVLAALLCAPLSAQAQVEIGMDAGVYLNTGFPGEADNITQIQLPAPTLRVGFVTGEMVTVETLASFQRESRGDESGSLLRLSPGVNIQLSDGLYVRGEGALERASADFFGESDSATHLGVGVAVGFRNAIKDGPVALRLEGGFLRWLENDDFPAYNTIRLLVGVVATVN